MGLNFIVSVADVDESQFENELPADYVLRLAEKKARAVTAEEDSIILAADTTVVDGSEILGKRPQGRRLDVIGCLVRSDDRNAPFTRQALFLAETFAARLVHGLEVPSPTLCLHQRPIWRTSSLAR